MKVLIALTTGYKRFIACCIVLGIFIIPACAAGQDIVLKDDFESERLSSIWSTDKLSENAIHHVSAPTRTGSGAIEIALHPYAKAEITSAGDITERAELMEASTVRLKMGVEVWYAFSFLLPSDFPIVKTRLVIAQWKQACLDCTKKRSPMVSLRYRDGEVRVDIEKKQGREKLYRQKMDLRSRWVDMVFRIMPKATSEGYLQVWMNGEQVADYRGALGFTDDKDEIYFKMGLYRNHMKRPMRIIIDRFRRGKNFAEVGILE